MAFSKQYICTIMDSSNKLKIKNLVSLWETSFKESNAFSPLDIQELKTHLLEQTDDLIEAGLDEEEAFLIASKRLGKPVNWEDEFHQTNQPFIQTRKTMLVLSGIISYYLLKYISLFLAKFSIVLGKQFNIETVHLVLVNKIILGLFLLFIVFFFTSLIINDKFLYHILDKIQIRPKQAIYIVMLILGFAGGDRCMLPLLRNSVKDIHWRNILFEMYMFFEYFLLAIIMVGFIIVYKRYFSNYLNLKK